MNVSLSTSPSTLLSYSSSPFSFDDEIELNFNKNEIPTAEKQDKDLDFIQNEISTSEQDFTTPTKILESLQNSIKHVKEKIKRFQEASSEKITKDKSNHNVDKTAEDRNEVLVNYLNKSENTYIDIKPLINMTINAFGLFNDVNPEEPYGPDDTKRVLHSMFQIWNPRVGPDIITLTNIQ